MNSQFLHYVDPDCLKFTATIQEILPLPNGHRGVILDRTYFYATGGGQEFDTGQIGDARVVGVSKDEERGVVVHELAGKMPVEKAPTDQFTGQVNCHIDGERRQRHRQHHSAQHLLTHCCLECLNLETLSANINGDTPSTLDLPFAELSKDDLLRAEDMANRLIYANLDVKSYFVTPAELNQIPLRKPPKVNENIRIVEIDNIDYSACGGTHVHHTGEIGLLKIVKTERVNDRLRLHFIAGWQALRTFQNYFDTLNAAANQMSIAPLDLPDQFIRQNEELQSTKKDLQSLRLVQIGIEAAQLAVEEGLKVLKKYPNRPANELRALADHLKEQSGMIAALASYDGEKISLIVSCATDSGSSAPEILRTLLAPFNGRGGGSPQLAQGGGVATSDQFEHLFDAIS